MSELLWQAWLLLAAAFFFGGLLACSLKRRFYYSRAAKSPDVAVSSIPHQPAPGEPKIEVTPRASAEEGRFDRAISGQAATGAAAVATAAAAATVAAKPAPPPEPAAAPTPAPAAAAPAPAAAAPAPVTTAPAVAPEAPEPAASAPPPEAKPISSISVTSGSGAPVQPQDGGAAPSDDLTRIRGIDSVVQKQLKDAGIRRFADIAGLTSADIKGLGERIGASGRIEQENWVGQAHILATGGETYYSRRVDRGMPVPQFTEPAAAVVAAAPAVAAAAVVPQLPLAASGPGDDLKRIRGVGILNERKLKELGVQRYADFALLNAADIKLIDDALGSPGRVDKENWVGQARVLAEGGKTYYALRLDEAQPAAAAPAPAPEPAPEAGPVVAPAVAAVAPVAVSEIAAAVEPPAIASEPVAASSAAETPAAEPTGGSVAPLRSVRSEAFVGSDGAWGVHPSRDGDDLKRIRGIGVLIEKKLNSLGIVHFEQVANWTGADIERISQILDFKGRIERENWVEQARILATGGQTEFSRRSDV